MIDLEWICSLPVEMLSVLYWLIYCSIDEIVDERYHHFDQARQNFLAAMDEEAANTVIKPRHDILIAHSMREMWSALTFRWDIRQKRRSSVVC